MARRSISAGLTRPGFLLAAALCAAALPAAVQAVVPSASGSEAAPALGGLGLFTPAGMDPELVRRAHAIAQERGLQFTPAGSITRTARPITVAVRVDQDVARVVTVQRAVKTAGATVMGTHAPPVTLTPTRFDLGAARGYQAFAQPAAPVRLTAPAARRVDVDDVPMADLAQFGRRLVEPAGRPSRFSSRVALATEEGAPGRTPRTLEALGEQSVDVSGSFRVLRNLDVTAGVRLSQDRDRIAPLTDAQQDDKAVYVGTQFRF
ncbi:hypothetical protein EYB45_02190 [Erythrobacteraceae bacterium CFH 75059]|uniref:hypothetical protein n=1 Tax=Qipengyuania thermophila TaxID=2509361 RepID=UPI00101FC26C|nr:hypothetical protein [Qipengyuania thermophila]TCD06546.1 hypothetical protein EYB45_02190 [Erythrobacteraceae bacterium CFH 75059]